MSLLARNLGLATSAFLLAACGSSSPVTAVPGGGGDQPLAPWSATPAMISNLGVYRGHEFIFQDYIHDDHGANTDHLDRIDLPFGAAPVDPNNPTDLRLSPAPITNYAGDFLYAAPSNHMDDVADLIEFRVKADAGGVDYRIRLADMTAPDSSVVAICVDEDRSGATGLGAWPLNAGLTEALGCDHLYTVYGSGAQVTDGAGVTRDLVAIGGAVSAEPALGLLHLRVPRALADPGIGTWRYYVASGLWDRAAGAWATVPPLPQVMGAPVVTGGGIGVPNIWDLLSNNHEPNSTWNEEKQANDLTAKNIIDHYVDVDFARLADSRDDPDPQLTGVIERIYESKYPTLTGRGTDLVSSVGTHFVYQGPWQPYVAVIPSDYYQHPERRFAFDLCLHPLGANHNVEVFYAEALARPDYDPLVTGVTPTTGYLGFAQITALVDRLDTVYACTLGRGEGLGYQGTDGMVDALEVQDEMTRLYRTDDEHRTIHGVSLGAIGTWYVSRLYPDRYAAAMPYIFSSDVMGGTTADPLLQNLYDLPVFFAIGTLDEFGQGTQGDPIADQLEGFGDEYFYLHYIGRQHEGRIENDFLPFTEALAYPRTRVRDPARVRYAFDPAKFNDKIPGTGASYWVSGMSVRDAAAGAAIVDVTALPRAAQLPAKQVIFDGLYTNVAKGYLGRMRGLLRISAADFAALWHPEVWEPDWQPVAPITVTETDLPVVATGNGLVMDAVNVATVQLDAARMNLGAGAVTYSVHTDGPLELRLSDGRRLVLTAAGQHDGSF